MASSEQNLGEPLRTFGMRQAHTDCAPSTSAFSHDFSLTPPLDHTLDAMVDPSPLNPQGQSGSSLDPPTLAIPFHRKVWSILNDDILPTPASVPSSVPTTPSPPGAVAPSPNSMSQALDLFRSLLSTPHGSTASLASPAMPVGPGSSASPDPSSQGQGMPVEENWAPFSGQQGSDAHSAQLMSGQPALPAPGQQQFMPPMNQVQRMATGSLVQGQGSAQLGQASTPHPDQTVQPGGAHVPPPHPRPSDGSMQLASLISSLAGASLGTGPHQPADNLFAPLLHLLSDSEVLALLTTLVPNAQINRSAQGMQSPGSGKQGGPPGQGTGAGGSGTPSHRVGCPAGTVDRQDPDIQALELLTSLLQQLSASAKASPNSRRAPPGAPAPNIPLGQGYPGQAPPQVPAVGQPGVGPTPGFRLAGGYTQQPQLQPQRYQEQGNQQQGFHQGQQRQVQQHYQAHQQQQLHQQQQAPHQHFQQHQQQHHRQQPQAPSHSAAQQYSLAPRATAPRSGGLLRLPGANISRTAQPQTSQPALRHQAQAQPQPHSAVSLDRWPPPHHQQGYTGQPTAPPPTRIGCTLHPYDAAPGSGPTSRVGSPHSPMEVSSGSGPEPTHTTSSGSSGGGGGGMTSSQQQGTQELPPLALRAAGCGASASSMAMGGEQGGEFPARSSMDYHRQHQQQAYPLLDPAGALNLDGGKPGLQDRAPNSDWKELDSQAQGRAAPMNGAGKPAAYLPAVQAKDEPQDMPMPNITGHPLQQHTGYTTGAQGSYPAAAPFGQEQDITQHGEGAAGGDGGGGVGVIASGDTGFDGQVQPPSWSPSGALQLPATWQP